MSDYRSIQRHIDFGRGKAGTHLGPPCSVYRVTNLSNGDYIQPGNLVQANVRVQRKINVTKADQESPAHSFGTLMFELYVDAEFWETGDVFVETDPFYGVGGTEVDFATDQFEAYCLAYHGPMKKTMAGRIDRTAQIYRPVEAADANGYFSPTINQNVVPVVCLNGVWGVAADITVSPNNIPVGIMAMPRDRDAVFKGVPGDTGQTMWFCYVPPLNGFNPREGDRIVFDSGRYVVAHPYQQQTGFVGSQLMIKRMIGND